MNNTTPTRFRSLRPGAAALVVVLGMITSVGFAATTGQETQTMSLTQTTAPHPSATLDARRQAILPIAAFAAAGDIDHLKTALTQGLDAGLTVSDCKEILVQLYAYAGFPRSLNALTALMQVLDARKATGTYDPAGREPGSLPAPDKMLEVGTANQTKLTGVPVSGPLFEFSPQVDRCLKEHLFGAIFARDNLDWKNRELATVGFLSALPGAESQLQSHMRISMNVGLTAGQLQQAVQVLDQRAGADYGRRAHEALAQVFAASTR